MALDMHFGSSMAIQLQRMLGKAIVSGAYEAGGFPNEAELASEYGASRTVVREAIKMLTAKGLINPRQGPDRLQPMNAWNLLDPDIAEWLTARPFSLDIYRQFIQMRLAVEPMAALLAAQSAEEDFLSNIRGQVEILEASKPGSDEHLRATVEFHSAILVASGNTFFQRLQNMIHTAIQMANAVPGNVAEELELRQKILHALTNRDGTGASHAMSALLQRAQDPLETSAG